MMYINIQEFQAFIKSQENKVVEIHALRNEVLKKFHFKAGKWGGSGITGFSLIRLVLSKL